MTPIFLLLVATLPSALGQCTTSKCQEQGYEPPRWENGAVYLERLLALTSDQMLKAVQEALETRLAAQTVALEDRLETRLAAQTATLETRLAAQTATLETRLAAQTAALEDRLETRLAAQTATLETRLAAQTASLANKTTALETRLAAQTAALEDRLETRLAAQTASLETRLAAQTAALEDRLTTQTASLETRLAAQTASLANKTTALEDRLAVRTATLQEKIASLEGRLTAATQDIGDLVTASQNASCSAATRDVGALVTAFQNASSQMAECCGRPVTTASPTVRPSTTPTVRPSATPTVRPSATPATTETPTTTPTTTETHLPVVFLRRQDGTVDFFRDWAAYKTGFGNQAGEFWLGLDTLHTLTTRHNYSLRADLTDWFGETKWAVYSTFRVAGEGDGYRLTVSGYNSDSTAGESMIYRNNGKRFSTRDRDNDGWGASCAGQRRGGWWYGGCTNANPTGLYKPAGYRGRQGISWRYAYNDWRSFKRVTLTLVLA